MKKIIIILISCILCGTLNAQTPNYKIENKTIILQSQNKSDAIDTGYTFLDNNDNINYKVYLSSKDKLFIIKLSKKTGNPYKVYLNNKLDEKLIKALISTIRNKSE